MITLAVIALLVIVAALWAACRMAGRCPAYRWEFEERDDAPLPDAD